MLKRIDKVREYAHGLHASVNHTYDGLPYGYHLDRALEVAERYIHLVPKKYRFTVRVGVLLHDAIEDTRTTPNDLVKKVGKRATLIPYALTNNKGWTREERADAAYYEGIRKVKCATFAKVCDRIANMEHSKETGSGMLGKYRKELPHFIKELYDPKYQEMFDYLKTI